MKILKLLCGVILLCLAAGAGAFAVYLAAITIMYRQGHTFHALPLLRAFAPWVLAAIVCGVSGFVVLASRNEKGRP